MLAIRVWALCVVAGLSACAPAARSDRQNAIDEVAGREIVFPAYPMAGKTYLSFSLLHGFQVNFIGSEGRAWLWYPSNTESVAEMWRIDARLDALCWTYPPGSRNPVVPGAGGREACEALSIARRTVIAEIDGDPYDLSSGQIPYQRSKCVAPPEFVFDRTRYRCG